MTRFISCTAAMAVALFGIAGANGSERMEDGKRAYERACAACHATGVEGAPVVGNKSDWQQRSDLWEAVLFEHAQLGYIRMPAKGGEKDASDYDVEAAAEYMIKTAKPDHPSD